MDNKQKIFLEALEASVNNITLACRNVQISRQTYYNWIASSEEFKTAVSEVRETVVDWLESELYKQIKDGSTVALIYALKIQGRSRGWNERDPIPEGDREKPLRLSDRESNLVEATRQKIALLGDMTVEELKELRAKK